MASIADLYINLLGNTTGFDQSMNMAAGRVSTFSQGVRSAMGAAMTGIGLPVVVGAGAAATAIGTIGAAAWSTGAAVHEATGDIQAQLGITKERAQEVGDVGVAVFANNFAGSVNEAIGAVAVVNQLMGDMPNDVVQRSAENAFRLQDAFGVDTSESIATARTLMDEFGLTSDQAFDFMATGMQRGLNASGDFFDSIGEYSNLFAEQGFAADQFFSAMETGMAGGVLGTDKIADAFKEAGIRIQELDDNVLDSLGYAGVNVNAMFQGLHDGSMTVSDAMGQILPAINAIENPIHRNSLGVQVFGTMWEDLGASAFAALDLQATGMADMQGAAGTLDAQYNTLGDAVEGYKRQAITALLPIRDGLIELATMAMPMVEMAFGWFETTLVPILLGATESVGTFITNFQTNMQAGMGIADSLKLALFSMVPPEVQLQLGAIIAGLQQFGSLALFAWQMVQTGVQTALAVVVPLIQSAVTTALQWWNENSETVLAVASRIWTGVQTAIQTVITIVSAIVQTAATNIMTWWNNNSQTILTTVQTVWATIQTVISTAMGIIQGVVDSILAATQGNVDGRMGQMLRIATKAFTAIQLVIENVMRGIGLVIGAAVVLVMGIWERWGDDIVAFAVTAFDLVLDTIEGVLDTIIPVLQGFRALFQGDWDGFIEYLGIAWDNLWITVRDVLSGLWNLLRPVFQGVWNSISTWWGGIDWGSLGWAIINGLIAALEAGREAVINMLMSIAQGAIDRFKKFFGIESPSRLMMQQGLFITDGLAQGIGSGSALVDAAFAKVKQPLVAGIDVPNVRQTFDRLGGRAVGGAVGRTLIEQKVENNYSYDVRDEAALHLIEWTRERQQRAIMEGFAWR